MVKRKTQLQKTDKLGKVITLLLKELHTLSQHMFNKVWQQHQFSNLTDYRLPDGLSTMVMDFVENYTCKTQDEVQA